MNTDRSVAIVGGGPCGLMMALLLARKGIRCVVFEKRSGISTHPKAMGVSRRTAELYKQLGLLEPIRNGSLAGEGRFLSIWSKSLVGEELGRVPFAHVPGEFTLCTGLHCPQTWTEKVLLDAVTAEPLAEVKFDCEVLNIQPNEDCVRLSLPGNQTVDVPWVVAADGAGSAKMEEILRPTGLKSCTVFSQAEPCWFARTVTLALAGQNLPQISRNSSNPRSPRFSGTRFQRK